MAVTMGKGEIKAYMCNVIDHMDEGGEGYRRFSELFLTAMGAIDAAGNLTEEYKRSPYWAGGHHGSPLRPSVQGGEIAKLSPDVRAAVMDMEGANA